jgi:hypothetical protein
MQLVKFFLHLLYLDMQLIDFCSRVDINDNQSFKNSMITNFSTTNISIVGDIKRKINP